VQIQQNTLQSTGIGAVHGIEPTESGAILFLRVQPPAESGCAKARVEPRRLREEVMLPLGLRQRKPDVASDASTRQVALRKFSSDGAVFERAPAQPATPDAFGCGEVLDPPSSVSSGPA
jgi:hypothetical protein